MTLRPLHATQNYEMRPMRRLVFNWPGRLTDAFVRVRDEGGQVTITYKAYENDTGIEKLETTVGDFTTAVRCSLTNGHGYRKGAHICDEPIIAFNESLPVWLKKLQQKD